MAWTLHLLLGITVMTASAYKCKHSYSNSDHDPRQHYDYANQEPVGIPDNRAYERMNTRSADVSPSSYIPNVPDEVKRSQLRIEEPTRRSENGSKVLSWKPYYAESRLGQTNDNSKIIFPGPTSEEYRLQIPDHCKKLGICEDVPNYPQDQANKVIAELSDITMFQNDKLDLPEIPDITQRVGPTEENMELCNFQEKVVYPKAAIDSSGNWHVVLNQDENPLQGFKVEICDVDSSPCSEIALIQPGYEARCKQKFVYRKMAVLQNGTKLEMSLKVPSCCSCVAKLVIR